MASPFPTFLAIHPPASPPKRLLQSQATSQARCRVCSPQIHRQIPQVAPQVMSPPTTQVEHRANPPATSLLIRQVTSLAACQRNPQQRHPVGPLQRCQVNRLAKAQAQSPPMHLVLHQVRTSASQLLAVALMCVTRMPALLIQARQCWTALRSLLPLTTLPLMIQPQAPHLIIYFHARRVTQVTT